MAEGHQGDPVVATERKGDRHELRYGALSASKKAAAQNHSLTKLKLAVESADYENQALRRKASELQRKCALLREAVHSSRAEEQTLLKNLEHRRLEAANAQRSRDSVLGAKYVIVSQLEERRRTIDTAAQAQLKRTSDELGLATSELRRLRAHVDGLEQHSYVISESIVSTKLTLAQTAARADDLRAAIALERSRRKRPDARQAIFGDATALRRSLAKRFTRK